MATKYFETNDVYKIAKDTSFKMLDHLPTANYLVKYNERDGFYLERTESFIPLSRVYGKSLEHADRILNTFMSRPASTGTLLVGEKGSGKTLLAREISIRGATKGIPTIIINAPYGGEAFMEFMAAIEQPTIILFDEFEKVYNPKKNDGQESILTLLDGVFQTRKLFLMTCNDKYAIDTYMINRPGRLFYTLDFAGLTPEFVVDYLNDVLVNKNYIDDVIKVVDIFKTFNFDMLKALVEEMNRYNESPKEALQLLNINPEKDYSQYDVEITTHEGYTLKGDNEVHPNIINNPMAAKPFSLTLYYQTVAKEHLGNAEFEKEFKEGCYDDERCQHPVFSAQDIVKHDGPLIFMKNEQGDVLKLTRKKEVQYNWKAF